MGTVVFIIDSVRLIATRILMPNLSSLRRLAGAVCLVLLAVGCRSSATVLQPSLQASDVSYVALTDSIPADPEMATLVAPFRDQLSERTSEIIGTATAALTRSRGWESSLGNFAADAMLTVVQRHTDRPVHMALTNNGGLRIPNVGPGAITVGTIYELMPFDNMLTILDFTGVQVDTLAQQLARRNGEPIAGFSFTVNPATRQATNIRVGDAPLDPAQTYRLVTSDYLANGGGVSVLQSEVPREELPVFLRDAFIQYIRDQQTLTPVEDGRIRAIN